MWLGQTVSRLDTRREVAAYVACQTSASRVCVTGPGAELSSSVVTVAELALLAGVAGNVQAQLDGLATTPITGAATSVVSANLTGGRVVVSSSTGKLDVGTTTTAQLSYLDATSSIQGQMDNKQPTGS